MTAQKRVGEMTDGEVRESAVARPVTYDDVESSYGTTIDIRDRFEELTSRDLSARAIATLKDGGEYDPQRHGAAGDHEPLTGAERLEVLALGAVLARHYRHPGYVHEAVTAGASWTQIAAATGSSADQARRDYRRWAHVQRRVRGDHGGTLGLGDAEYAAALRRSAEPEAEAEAGR